VSLSAEVVELLRLLQRKHQRELMMANRTTYRDIGLAFAKEWGDLQRGGDTLGHPLQINNLGQRESAKLIKAAEVRPIKFHGLRYTCATLLLQAGQPIHVVSERLGHSKVSMTMEVDAHVLPDMQREAADTLGALLHG
jgi:integrase